MKRIAVLLSSYNGEAFISSQIESILRQTCGDAIRLFIRDDGSTDHTREKIAALDKGDGKITLFEGENVGAKNSFFELLAFAKRLPEEFEFFAFSDQDDQWDLDKIEIALSSLCEQRTKGEPVLYASTSCMVDANLKPIQKRAPRRLKPLTPFNALVQCAVPGHTYVFNRRLLDAIPEDVNVSEIYYHDTFVLNVALLCGTVIYDPWPHANYRQHSLNQMGVEKNFFRWLATRFKRVQKGDSRQYARQFRYLYELYANQMSPDVRHEMERFLNSQTHVWTRIGYALSTRLYRQKFLETLAFKALYVLGGYNLPRVSCNMEIP
jgi:rhamnosyltransferase